MKMIFKEYFPVDYDRYRFPYCIYGIKEPGDAYSDIYQNGFLPYTNDLTVKDEVFYLARSVRIPLLPPFFNYKQNNVLNKFRDVYPDDCLTFELIDKQDYEKDPFFRDWCLSNAKHRFLSEERLTYILSRPYLTHIMRISLKDKILAYILPVYTENSFFHVWFSFYDSTIRQNDFGKWILLKVMEWSCRHSFPLFYMGTCYSLSAFYKLTLSPRAYYYDGMAWNPDTGSLKKRLAEE